jgi:uncharacterized protein
LAVTELKGMQTIRRTQVAGTVLLLMTAVLIVAGCSRTPKLEGRVTDLASAFSAAEAQRISSMLSACEDETSHQLAVLTVPSLEGESLEAFSLRVANAWGLGRKGVDNGILVTLAMRERAARIELGLGFEPYISDAAAGEIMNQTMIPAFARGQFAEGVEAGLTRLMNEGRKFAVPKP